MLQKCNIRKIDIKKTAKFLKNGGFFVIAF